MCFRRWGEVRIGEANTPVVDRVVSAIKQSAGAPTAKSCRSVISGVMGLAVRFGAVDTNPVREVDRIEGHAKRSPRALTAAEVSLLRKQLAADEKAVRADLPDLITFMLATGVRIRETHGLHRTKAQRVDTAPRQFLDRQT